MASFLHSEEVNDHNVMMYLIINNTFPCICMAVTCQGKFMHASSILLIRPIFDV